MVVNELSPAIETDSGRWNAGFRLDIIVGVKTSTLGLTDGEGVW